MTRACSAPNHVSELAALVDSRMHIPDFPNLRAGRFCGGSSGRQPDKPPASLFRSAER
jgi:hypothetical protein